MTDKRLVLSSVYQRKTPDRESHKVSVGRDRLGVLGTVCVDDSIVEPPSYVSSLNGWFRFLNGEVENDNGVDSSVEEGAGRNQDGGSCVCVWGGGGGGVCVGVWGCGWVCRWVCGWMCGWMCEEVREWWS